MEEIIEFLNQIVVNNNRIWFMEHKQQYLDAQAKFNEFAERLLVGIQKFDDLTKGLTLKDCTYRFYRDTRFSLDKSPYKRHFGVFVSPHGKCSGLAGYYFHIEGEGAEYLGRHGLFPGMYKADPKVAKSIREDINVYGADFENAVKKARNFTLSEENSLKKMPKGFAPDHKYSRYLKLKDYCLSQSIPNDILYSNNLIEWALEEFRSCYDFNSFLNRAALFSRENE